MAPMGTLPITPPSSTRPGPLSSYFRSSHFGHRLQMADLMAYALLLLEEEPSLRVERMGIYKAFGILYRAFNRRASRRDPPLRNRSLLVVCFLP